MGSQMRRSLKGIQWDSHGSPKALWHWGQGQPDFLLIFLVLGLMFSEADHVKL